jgi:hypothetical protein
MVGHTPFLLSLPALQHSTAMQYFYRLGNTLQQLFRVSGSNQPDLFVVSMGASPPTHYGWRNVSNKPFKQDVLVFAGVSNVTKNTHAMCVHSIMLQLKFGACLWSHWLAGWLAG